MKRAAAGFTIIELLIVTILGSLVVLAAYQVLLVNQRTYTAQNAQIQSQQTVRAGMDVLFGELREISRGGSDVIGFWQDSVKVRVGRNFGLVCATDIANGNVDVRKVGSWFGVGDSVVVYAENSVSTVADDDWIHGRVSARDTTVVCNGAAAQRLTIPQITTAAANFDTVRVGGNVRSYTTYRYGQYADNGVRYLGRKDSTNVMQPLVGPVRDSLGVGFRYLDSVNAVTTDAAKIAQIEVTIRTLSSARGPDGEQITDSITTRVYLRN
jgi:prepilin-type N-terminal cleavage/methylation domain-containing protein